MTAAGAARWTAMLIAVMAVLDPACTRTRPVRAGVAVVAAPGAEEDADRVAASLDDEFEVVRALVPTTAATVLVGSTVPDAARTVDTPVIVALGRTAGVRLDAVRVPGQATLSGQVPVDVEWSRGAAVGRITLALEYEGARVDELQADADAPGAAIRMTFLPVRPGPAVIRVTARGDTGVVLAAADAVTRVDDPRWRVLFHDTRPSWMSTFVRRALEGDRRFDIVTRVVTSRDVSIARGLAPGGLDDTAALASFDAVVVGAPGGLDARDVAALETFARRSGGTIVLPLDQQVPGAWDRLAGRSAWRAFTAPSRMTIQPAESWAAALPALPAMELSWPAALPPGAERLAVADTPLSPDAPIVWRVPLGAGAVLVSGALDAWRFRAEGEGFRAFWRGVMTDAAARALPDIAIAPPVILTTPGARVAPSVLLRDIALDPGVGTASATLSATLDAPGGPERLALWPAGPAGHLELPLVAPLEPGVYTVTVTDGSTTGQAQVVVRSDLAVANPDESPLAAAWAGSRGGRVVDAADPDTVRRALREVITAPLANAAWRPMRSPWWIAPFAVLLGAEWWWRRRHGLP